MAAKALWYVANRRAELRDEAVAAPAAGELRVRARFGAISRGTERLVFEGRVPESEFERMRAPFMAGDVPVSGQIRLFDRRHGGGGAAARPHGVRAASASERVRRAGAGRRGGAGRRAAAARGARRQYGDGAQRGLGRRARARRTASRSSAAVWSGSWSRGCARGCRAPQVTVVDVAPGARRAGARVRRGLRDARRRARGLRCRLPCQRQRRRACHRAAARRRGGARSWS